MKPSTTLSRMRTNAGVSSRFGRWIRKQPNEPHQEPRMYYGDLMRGGRMEMRTGAATRACEPPSPGLAALPFIVKPLGVFFEGGQVRSGLLLGRSLGP